MWKEGKLPELPLKRSVLRKLHPGCSPDCREFMSAGSMRDPDKMESACRQGIRNAAERTSATAGSETARSMTVAVCEVPGFENDPGKLVLSAANGLYAGGAAPEGLVITALLPCDCEERQLQEDMKRIADSAAAMEMNILGGHTQVSSAVSRPVYAVTGTGTCLFPRRPLRPGDTLILTKWTALGGTVALARRYGKQLSGRFSFHILEAVGRLEQDMSVRAEAEILNRFLAQIHLDSQGEPCGESAEEPSYEGRHRTASDVDFPCRIHGASQEEHLQKETGESAVRDPLYTGITDPAVQNQPHGVVLDAAVHDLSQGGILGALREMAEFGGVGLDIDLREIPIRQETIELCEYFDINPYELYSGGSLLIGLPQRYAVQLTGRLEKKGIPAAVIGFADHSNARILRSRNEIRYLDRASQDAWYRTLEQERNGRKK